MDRVRDAERAVAVSARPFVGDSVSKAADADVRDAHPGAVDRDEPVDAALELLIKEVLHTPQIPQALFPNRRDERDGAVRLSAAPGERPYDGEQHGQAAAVIADAGSPDDVALTRSSNRRVFWKHRVEVRAEHQVRTRRKASALADDVAGAIDPDVREAERLERLLQRPRAPLFLEWRRGNLAQTYLIFDDLRLIAPDALERRLRRDVLEQPFADGSGALLRGNAHAAEGVENDKRQKRDRDRACHTLSIVTSSNWKR